MATEEQKKKYPAFNFDDEGDAGPPSSTSDSTYIGVPKDYKPIGLTPAPDRYVFGMPESALGQHTAYGTSFNPNPYQNGDENLPLATPEVIPKLQMQLVAAGVLSPRSFNPGVWDASSAAAYRSVMAMANASGADVRDMLAILQNNPQAASASGASSPGPFQLTAPEDVRSDFRSQAQQMLGMNLPDNEMKQFENMYQAQEKDAYGRLAQAQLTQAAGGNELIAGTQAPSTTAAAEEYINTHHLADKIAYGAASRMQDFFGMLKSAGGGLTAAEGQ